jgi:hypothetical protein
MFGTGGILPLRGDHWRAELLDAHMSGFLLKGFGWRPFAGALGLGAGPASESLVRKPREGRGAVCLGGTYGDFYGDFFTTPVFGRNAQIPVIRRRPGEWAALQQALPCAPAALPCRPPFGRSPRPDPDPINL